MCDLVSFIQMFQYVSPQLFWQGTICLFIYLYSFSYNNVSVKLKPNVMVCAFLFRLKWNEMFLIEMMIIFNRNELLNTVDRHYAWLDHFLWAVICRSRGGLSTNGREEKFALNDNMKYSNLTAGKYFFSKTST